jgi:hypothetical protein
MEKRSISIIGSLRAYSGLEVFYMVSDQDSQLRWRRTNESELEIRSILEIV